MTKILIGNKEQKAGYFEVGYTFYLDVPQAQQEALAKKETISAAASVKPAETVTTEAATVDSSIIEKSGIASYSEGTSLEDIKADLIKRFNEEQNKLNSDDKLSFCGLAWDGEAWA